MGAPQGTILGNLLAIAVVVLGHVADGGASPDGETL